MNEQLVFVQNIRDWKDIAHGIFQKPDFKKFLEDYFNIKL